MYLWEDVPLKMNNSVSFNVDWAIMKSVLSILLLFSLFHEGSSQVCSSFYLMQQNRNIQFAQTSNKGISNGSIQITTSVQREKDNVLSSMLHTSLLNRDGRQVGSGLYKVTCNNGVLMVDMAMFIPRQQAEQFNKNQAVIKKNSLLEYPAKMRTDDQLKDGHFLMEIDNNGVQQILQLEISNRRVTGTEKISTKAGSFDCVTITYQVKLNVQTGPIVIPLNFNATEWFAPGFGTIKTQSESGITTLSKISG